MTHTSGIFTRQQTSFTLLQPPWPATVRYVYLHVYPLSLPRRWRSYAMSSLALAVVSRHPLATSRYVYQLYSPYPGVPSQALAIVCLALAVPGVGVGGFSFTLAILSRRFVLLVWALLPGVSSGRQIYFTRIGPMSGLIWGQARGFTVHHRPCMVGINPALPFR